MRNYRENFAANMLRLRGDRTQAEMAEFLDVPLRSYQKWEAGIIPQKRALAAIVERCGLESEASLFQEIGGAGKATQAGTSPALPRFANLAPALLAKIAYIEEPARYRALLVTAGFPEDEADALTSRAFPTDSA